MTIIMNMCTGRFQNLKQQTIKNRTNECRNKISKVLLCFTVNSRDIGPCFYESLIFTLNLIT